MIARSVDRQKTRSRNRAHARENSQYLRDSRGRIGLDLRLVPLAVVVWGTTAFALAWTSTVVVVAAGMGCAAGAAMIVGRTIIARRAHTHAWLARVTAGWISYLALPVVGAIVAGSGVMWRKALSAQHPLTHKIAGVSSTELTLTSTPRVTEIGAMVQGSVPGLPGRVWVFGSEDLLAWDKGTTIQTAVAVKESSRPSVSGLRLTLRGTPEIIDSPSGVVARVRGSLQEQSEQLWHGADKLLPAMTLGDERGFSAVDHAIMTNAGLSHLTAVSGANVMLVVGAVMGALSWTSPKVRVLAAAATLWAFIAVVGSEPSVLRAVLTGVVGLLAIILGRPGQSIPALAGGATILLLLMPDLAVSVGFMLSVSATAGIVLLAEPLARRLATRGKLSKWPAPIVRGLSVAIVAHCVTVPVLAIFIGQVSHISVVANLAVAAAVPPVTVLGSMAALCAAIGVPALGSVFLWLATPCAWWVFFIAELASRLTSWVGMGSGAVSVIGSTAVGGALWCWPRIWLRLIAAGLAASICVGTIVWVCALHIPRAPAGWVVAACEVDGRVIIIDSPATARAAAASRDCRIALALDDESRISQLAPEKAYSQLIATPKEIDIEAHATTAGAPQWFVVKQCGEKIRRIAQTPAGVAVACPGRDGPQALQSDGSIWRGW